MTASATRASWSPQTDRISANHRDRNSATPTTSRNPARRVSGGAVVLTRSLVPAHRAPPRLRRSPAHASLFSRTAASFRRGWPDARWRPCHGSVAPLSGGGSVPAGGREGRMVEVTVALLGAFELRVGGRPVPVPSSRQRALLAALALSAGRTVAVEGLVEQVWGEELPARP